MLNGISFFDFNLLDPFLGDGTAKIALRKVENADRYGHVVLDEGRVTKLARNRPQVPASSMPVSIVSIAAFSIGLGTDMSRLKQTYCRFVAAGEVQGRIHDGPFIDIGVPDDFERAQTLLPKWQRRPAAFPRP